jgi:predicted nucleic acid-binding protein
MAEGLSLVVDTSVWIDYYRGRGLQHESWLDLAMEQRPILVPNLVALEILRGTTDHAMARGIERDLRGYDCFDLAGFELATVAAENYRRLRGRGITIRSSIDLLIGTWCIEHGVALLHNDRDFDAMEQFLGLLVWRGESAPPELA